MTRRAPLLLAPPSLLAALALAGCPEEADDDSEWVGEVLDDDSAGSDDDSDEDWGPIEQFEWRTPWWDDDPSGDAPGFDIRNWRYRTNGRLIEWILVPYGDVDPETAATGMLYYIMGEPILLYGEGTALSAEHYDADGILIDSWDPKTAYPVTAEGGVGFGATLADLDMVDPGTGEAVGGLSLVTFADYGYDLFLDPKGDYYQYIVVSLLPPAPDLYLDQLAIVEDFNGDLALSAGETARLQATLTNIGDAATGPGVEAVISIVSNSTAEATLEADTTGIAGGAAIAVRETVTTDEPGFQVTIDPGATADQFLSFTLSARHADGTEEGAGTFFFEIH